MNASSQRLRAVSWQVCASIERLENRVFLAAGDLDPTFGSGGTVTLGANSHNSVFEDTQLTAEGKIVSISARGWDQLSQTFTLEERDSSGVLDTNFGSGGRAGIGFDAKRLLILADGKVLVGGTLDEDFAVSRYLANGQLDSSFGLNGLARLDLNNSSNDQASLMTLQPDGKILLAGITGLEPAIARFTADGQVDTGFDRDGVAIGVPQRSNLWDDRPEAPTDILVQASGRILLAGSGPDVGLFATWLLPFRPDGTPDSDFHADSRTRDYNDVEGPHLAAAPGDGFYIVSTEYGANSLFQSEASLYRYDANGNQDSTFGGQYGVGVFGQASDGGSYLDTYRAVNAIFPQADGKVLIYSARGSTPNILKRYNADGALDLTFGPSGTLQLASGDQDNSPRMLQLVDGSFLLSGYQSNGYTRQLLARFRPDGTLIDSFGSGGMVVAPLEPEVITGSGHIAVANDGKLIVATTGVDTDSVQRIMIVRLNPDGTMDNSFDGNGIAELNLDGQGRPTGVIALADGKILVTGTNTAAGVSSFVVARVNADGSPDDTFADGGKLATSAGQVAALPDGRIVLLTSDQPYTLHLFTVGGQVDSSFGDAGQLALPAELTAPQVAAAPDGTIVVAGTVHRTDNGGYDELHLYRYDTAGQLLSGFRNGFTGLRLIADSVVAQGDGKILVNTRMHTRPDSADALSSARFNPDGSLDQSFGQLGVNLYAVGRPTSAGKYANVVYGNVGRYLANGERDIAFGDHGYQVDPSRGPQAVVIGNGDRIIVVSDRPLNPILIQAYQTTPPKAVPVVNPGPRLAVTFVQVNADPTYLLDAVTHQQKKEFNFNPLNSSSPATLADLNGDGAPELIAATVEQGRAQIKVMDGQDYASIGGPRASWTPFPGLGAPSAIAIDPYYAQAYPGAINLASRDVNDDGVADIVAAVACAGPPHVKVFSGTDGSLLWSFLAFPGPGGSADTSYFAQSFRGGVRLACADINGDGYSDIVTAAGPGAGPHVKVFSGKDLSVLSSFWAFDPTFFGGVEIAAGDWNGDGPADIAAAAGPGVGPHVQVFDGRTQDRLASFFAYDQSFRGGARLAMLDVDGDGLLELLSVPASIGAAHVKAFRLGSGDTVDTVQSFFAVSTYVAIGAWDYEAVGPWAIAG